VLFPTCGNSYKDNFTEKLAKLKGDVNADGKFNISDAVILQKNFDTPPCHSETA